MPQNSPWYRIGHTKLVFCGIIGNGSKFFLNWVSEYTPIQIERSSIDWRNDTVIGNITDPIERRHRGIGVWLDSRGFDHSFFLKNNDHYYFLEAPCFDNHAEPISAILADDIDRVKWIPFDNHDIDPYMAIYTVFLEHGITLDLTKTSVLVKDSYDRIHLTNIVREHYKSSSQYSETIDRMYRKDMEVYCRAIHQYKPCPKSG